MRDSSIAVSVRRCLVALLGGALRTEAQRHESALTSEGPRSKETSRTRADVPNPPSHPASTPQRPFSRSLLQQGVQGTRKRLHVTLFASNQVKSPRTMNAHACAKPRAPATAAK